MAKIFYTERDIDDLLARGVTTLEVNDSVVLTDLARERAFTRGLRLVRVKPIHPEDLPEAELIHRVKAAVLARLDGQVDLALLDAVVTKVIRELT